MGDDRIYDSDFPQQVLDLRTVLYTQALTGARPNNLRQKVPDFLKKSGTLLCFRFFNFCCSQTSSVFPDPKKYHRRGTLPICGKYHEIKVHVQ